MITSNISATGELDTDAFRIAMLQYRNTPDPETKVSPAMCVFGRPIKDFIPVLPGRYEPHPTWRDTLDQREEALRVRHMKAQERWAEHTKRLPPLKVGDLVRIQNQVGPHPTKWDKTGVIIEVRQFDQYIVRVDGSGRATLRNRKFLRQYVPAREQRRPRSITDDLPPSPAPSPFVQPAPSPFVQPAPSPFVQPFVQPNATPVPTKRIVPLDHTITTRDMPTSPVTVIPEHIAPTHTATSTPPPSQQVPRVPTVRKAAKLPLALRRLASFNTEGKKGLGEYKPSE